MSKKLDNPNNNDNRQYDYSAEGFYVRDEFSIIADWIFDGAKVIDLGCGNGSLMRYILDKKQVSIEGIEVSQSGVDFCLANGLSAQLGEIDKRSTYSTFIDKQFDFAVCNVTLHMVLFPEVVLQEMSRIATHVIVSFPNFAYIKNRLDLLCNGVMPRPLLYSYTWYNTGHIHQLSLKDFQTYCKDNRIEIIRQRHLGCCKSIARICLPNVFSKETVFLCQKP